MGKPNKETQLLQEIDQLNIIRFEPPLAPVRVATDGNDSTTLDFKCEKDRLAAERNCNAEVLTKCKDGARQGCALKAARKCRIHWILRCIGFKEREWAKVEACEEQAMQDCVLKIEGECRKHAATFCVAAFRGQSQGNT